MSEFPDPRPKSLWSSFRPNRPPTLIEGLTFVALIAVLVAVLVTLWFPAPKSAFTSASREKCQQNLKLIGLALHTYHDAYKCFPPAYVADEHGTPMHSWRVLLLPFLEQQALYDEYRFDEPWNGPNNIRLADRVVELFNCASENRKANREGTTMTNYVAVIGERTIWPGRDAITLDDIPDGAEQTIAVVEIADSDIHWMEPRDLDFSRMDFAINNPAKRGVASVHPGGAMVLYADGHVGFVSESNPPDTIQALLSRDGGETVEVP